MMKPLISIIIPCYNMGAYLKEAVYSVRSDKYNNKVELIIVNDGSNQQDTLDVLNELEKEGFFVLHQENQGLGCARNNGIRMSRGQYIIPLDADNKLRKEFIDIAISIFEETPQIDILYSDAFYFGEKTGDWIVGEYDFSKLLKTNYIDACACYRKSVWEDLNGYDEKMPVMGSEDWDFWLRASVKGFKFKYINKVLFDYRVRENSMVKETINSGSIISKYVFKKKELSHLKEIRSFLFKASKEKKITINQISMEDIFKLFLQKIRRRVFK